MNTTEIRDLCITLAQAESEDAVITILTKAKLWDNKLAWKEYDNNPNNFSTIGNQQSSPDAALVEKLVNSADAVLTRECLRRGISPDSNEAPKNIHEALKSFFSIQDGKLSNVDPTQRTKLADNILLIATGQRSNPNYIIADKGEGQSPQKMPSTFLSLNKSNKLKIPFVQGKFNMGGAGSLQFCSPRHNLQLIISKRDPAIKDSQDSTADYWGFTIIRREDPPGNMRSSIFKYLAPDSQVLRFKANSLPLLPQKYPEAYGSEFDFGTFIKLYEYQIKGYRTNVTLDLYNRLALLLPGAALPIRMVERRRGYSAHSYETTLSGLNIRLEEDKNENLEENFPNSVEMNIAGEPMKVLIYAFKKEKRAKYSKSEGIVFTVNGQTHGFLTDSFFERKSVGMAYLADSILVIADCSSFKPRTREDLFMNSRDRLRDGSEIKQEIEKQLEELIHNHAGLRQLREQRRREEIENKLKDAKPFADLLENIIKKSPTLSNLLIKGLQVSYPFSGPNTDSGDKYEGKKFPTFFTITKQYTPEHPKPAVLAHRVRFQFETDAENEYFNRDKDPGEMQLSIDSTVSENYTLNLWNGQATLSLEVPENTIPGQSVKLELSVSDPTQATPFLNYAVIILNDNEENPGLRPSVPRPPRGSESTLALPNMIEVSKDDPNWKNHFKEDSDALAVVDAGDGGYDFYLNIDNKYLRLEEKSNLKLDPKIVKARFKFGMVLVGLSLLNQHNSDNSSDPIPKTIAAVTNALSPILLPMINALGELDSEA